MNKSSGKMKVRGIQTARGIPAVSMTAIATALALASCASDALAQRPLGIDVSSYQGTPNWSSVRSDGVEFAWAKATEGTTITDGDFTYNASNGKAAGVYMGAYHFAHPNSATPASEENHFWSVAGGYIKADGKTLMPMLDMEVFSGVDGASSYSDWANQWCNDAVSDAAAAGVRIKPAIYVSACNACEFNSSVAQWGSDIADYNGENLYTGTPWSTCTGCEVWGSGVWNFWQVSDTGAITGISGNVDLDGYNGTLSGLVANEVATSIVSAGESLGGVFTANIGCCSWAANRLDLIGVGTDGSLYHKWWDGTAWGPSKTAWQLLPFGTGWHGDVGAVSWGSGRIDFFVQGANNHCYHGFYTSSGGWQGMEDLGGVFVSDIGFGAASWASGRLDIFGVAGASDNLYHAFYTVSTGWSGWENLGGSITTTPGAVSWGPNRIDIFGRGTDGACYQKYWDGAWHGFYSLGGGFEAYGMGVSSMGSGMLNVVGVGGGAGIYQRTFNGTWGSWVLISDGPSTSTTSAVSWGSNRIDTFFRGSDNACHHLWSD